MKKYILLFILCFVFGFIFRTGIYYLNAPRTHGETVHVFFEVYATNPALSQMVEFAKLPKSARKLIAWHRFPNRKNVLDLDAYNTAEINIIPKEGFYGSSTRRVFREVMKIYAQNPDTRFVLYTNFSHQNITLAPFLNKLPQENIKHIHLFEDGYGDLLKSPYHDDENGDKYTAELIEQLPDILQGKLPWKTEAGVTVHKLYPVTYHFMLTDEIKKNKRFKPLINWLKDADVQNIDFDDLRMTMSEEQKRVVYRLSGFDYDTFYPLMHNKPTIVYALGYFFGNKKNEKAQLNLLNSLRMGQLDFLTNDKKYTWFYKPHPSLDAKKFTEEIKTHYPDMIEIPAQVPFEVLILAGLKPTKTIGYGSSFFYSLNADDVLLYIKRGQKDRYMEVLQQIKKLRQNQTIDLRKFTDDYLCRSKPLNCCTTP